MPEGPEVWALSYALQKLGLNCKSYGKHLLHEGIDYSFGLSGAIKIDKNLTITKVNKGFVYGSQQNYDDTFVEFAKLDWVNASKDDIQKMVNEWKKTKPKHKIISLLKDQSEICGLGVAWISEIMNNAQLPIDTTMENCNNLLVDSIYEIRDQVKLLYQNEIDKLITIDNLIQFVNKWCYHNLYKIRQMKVYKHPSAKQIKCCGRIFYQLV